ncbi:MAG: hypothetical protein HKN41_05845 [Ilumatobacter sp.]|nr:hypothetical protein [Ilumatobacter sp.]
MNAAASAAEPRDTDDLRDELPDDINAAEFVGAYQFPDNSRRRIPGVLYLVMAAGCVAAFLAWGDSSPVVNDGYLWAAALLAAVGVIAITSGWRMQVDEKQALVEAQRAIGFPVGHASAQQVWFGFRSRPTWRVLCYSTEEPPTRRGLVLVDAVDGHIVQHLVEDNPEQWRSDD